MSIKEPPLQEVPKQDRSQTNPIRKESPAPLSREVDSNKYIQEKIMLGLIMVFFGGVLALTFIPDPFKSLAMGLIVFLTMVAMFKIH
jgi:hypothetical protein